LVGSPCHIIGPMRGDIPHS